MSHLDSQDFHMFQRDTVTLQFTARDTAGDPIDLTAATLSWSMAREPEDVALLTKTNGSGVTITDAVAGQFEVELMPANTTGLRGHFYHEARLEDAAGETVVAWGRASIEPTLNP